MMRLTTLSLCSVLLILAGPEGWHRGSAHAQSGFALHPPCDPHTIRLSQANCRPHGWYPIGLRTPGVWANVTADPSGSGIIYSASVGGGVRKSIDNGATWTSVNNGLPPNAAVYSFALDAASVTTAYAGVFLGTPRIGGVFKTTDGGMSWSQVSSPTLIPPLIPLSLGADPHIPGRVFAGNLGGPILRSLDGGATWLRVYTGTSPVTSIVVDPFNSNIVYASTLAGLLKSTNAGATWTNLPIDLVGTAKDAWSVAIDPTNENSLWVATNTHGVWHSVNQGASWTQAGSLGVTPFGVAIDSSSNNVFLTTTAGVWESSDDGASWRATALDDRMAISIQIGSDHTLYVGTDEGPAFSSNLGVSWTNPDPTEGGASAFGYSVTVDPIFGRKLFAATLGATAMTSANDGLSWTPVGTDYAARESRKINVDPTDSSRVYSGSFFSGLFKSTDGGATWSRRTVGSGYAYVWVPVVDPVSPNIVWAGTSGEGLFKSTDYGDTFTAISGMPSVVQGVAVDPRNDDIVYAASGSGLLRSSDGGTSWLNVLARAAWTVTIVGGDSHVVYAATKTFGVYRSTDDGLTWTAINNGITNLNMSRSGGPLIDPTNTRRIYVGSEACGCVYKSIDGGDSWFSVSDGLANTLVFGLAQDPRRPGVLFVAGPGGIFETTTGGE
jgi:photosystem II stability/assembly factor-like uncharacterized protein